MVKKDFYHDIIHNAPIGYVLYEVIFGEAGNLIDLKFVETNPAFTTLTGLSPKDVIGRKVTDVIPNSAESLFDWVAYCAQAAEQQSPSYYRQYFSIFDRWFTGCIYVPRQGYLIALFYDVTQEQQVAEQHDLLINSLLDLVLDIDRDFRIVNVYTGNESLLLRPAESYLGARLQDLPMEPDLIERFNHAYLMAAQTGKRQTIEYHLPKDDRWYRAVVEFLAVKDQFRIIIREITEQKKAESILQKFFNVASDYLCIMSEDGCFLTANQAFCRQVGMDVTGMSYKDLVHPQDVLLVEEAIKNLVLGQPRGGIAFRARLQDKEWHYLEWKATAYDGLVYAAGRDITEQLNQAEEMRLDNLRLVKLVELLQLPFSSNRELIDFTLEQGLSLTGSRWGSFYKYDKINNNLILVAHTSDVYLDCKIQEQSRKVYSVAESKVWVRTIIRGQPFYFNDYAALEADKKIYPEGHLPITRFLSVPVLDSEGLKGMVIVSNKETPYTDKDAMQLTLFMNAVWQAGKSKRNEIALRKEQEWTRVTLEAVGEGVISVDSQGKIILVNRVAEQLTGWSQEEAKGRTLGEVVITMDEGLPAPVESLIDQAVRMKEPIERATPVVLKAKDGTELLVAQRVVPLYEKGILSGAVIALRDITIEHRKKQHIIYLSQHDELTGLFNRGYMEQELQRWQQEGQLPISLILGDVNALKMTNDAFGHEAGDQLLIQTANILKSCCRPQDVLARWGGDEFLLALPGVGHEEAHHICDYIREQFAGQDENSLGSISLGCATWESDNQSIKDVLRQAEDYMYRRKLLESKSLRSTLIASITRTLDEKSHETEAHAQRLRANCKKVGIAMGLREHQLNELELLSVLHDIGKIAVDDHILNKPTSLDEEEWREMQRHPEVGYRITQLVPELSVVAEHILCHHEHWDGSGYPQGLKMQEIPLLARILAVADAYDAMTNDRPYRRALTKEQAIDELTGGAGSQFDPQVVSVFVDVISRNC